MARGRARRRAPKLDISTSPPTSLPTSTAYNIHSETGSNSVNATSDSAYCPTSNVDSSVPHLILSPGGVELLVTKPSGRKVILTNPDPSEYPSFTMDNEQGDRFLITTLALVSEAPSLVTSNEPAYSTHEGSQGVVDSTTSEIQEMHPPGTPIILQRFTLADLAAVVTSMEDHGIAAAPPGSPRMTPSNFCTIDDDSRIELRTATPAGSQYGFFDTAYRHDILTDPSYPVASEIFRPSSRQGSFIGSVIYQPSSRRSYQGGSHTDYPTYASFRGSDYAGSRNGSLHGSQSSYYGSNYGPPTGSRRGSYLGSTFCGERQGSLYNANPDFDSYTNSTGPSTSKSQVPAILRVRREAANVLISGYEEKLKKQFAEDTEWGIKVSEWEEREKKLREKIRVLKKRIRRAEKGRESRAGEGQTRDVEK